LAERHTIYWNYQDKWL